jgi:hypothetical protein
MNRDKATALLADGREGDQRMEPSTKRGRGYPKPRRVELSGQTSVERS